VRRAYEILRQAANAQPYLEAAARRDRLDRLERLLVVHAEDIVRAISEDFGHRVPFESRSADVLLPLSGVRHARRHLRRWMRRRRVGPHPLFLPSRAWVEPMPRGVVAILAPWNYPVNLALGPAGAALAAGNRVLLKPSERTPRTSALLHRTVSEYFRPEEFVVIEGGPEVAREIAGLPLDHLCFTGSTAVGRLVAQAAAGNLVPTTLELGGKSPALVHASCRLEHAAARIAIGKTYNAGQTCIAPDYALVPAAQAVPFVDLLQAHVGRLHAGGMGYTSMASEAGRQRMMALVADAQAKGAKVVTTFPAAPGTRGFGPVILLDVRDDMRVMQEEIFGPILPVETYTDLDEALARLHARPRPLAFYYFDDDSARVAHVLRQVPSGGACVNDTLVHFAQEQLPFGGLGASGWGAYHGLAGFDTFSHLRSVLVASRASPAYRLLAPPFSSVMERAVGFLISGGRGWRRR
jgi:coniferyl-aldehyde dehydrogenase